jgi:hypothetical protein
MGDATCMFAEQGGGMLEPWPYPKIAMVGTLIAALLL